MLLLRVRVRGRDRVLLVRVRVRGRVRVLLVRVRGRGRVRAWVLLDLDVRLLLRLARAARARGVEQVVQHLEIWGRYGGDMGEIWGSYGGDMGRMGSSRSYSTSL